MAKATSMKAQVRQHLGKRAARAARRDGMLPAIVYGHGQDNLAVALPEHDFAAVLHHGVHLLELELGKKKTETVLIKEVQYDHLGTNPVHADLVRVDLSERVAVEVPVVLRGTPAGVDQGGSLQQILMELEIECLVTDIPEEIRVKVTDMAIGDTLHARDVELPAGAKLLTDPEAAVATVTAKVEEVEEVAEAAAESAEPEVIGKGKEQEDQASGTPE